LPTEGSLRRSGSPGPERRRAVPAETGDENTKSARGDDFFKDKIISVMNMRKVIIGVLIGLLLAGLVYWRQPLWELFTNQERVRAWIQNLGPWAPFGAILLVALKVLVAPFPGQIVGTINGFLFGTLMGTFYSMVGMLLGTIIAMNIGRHAGRPVVSWLVGRKTLEKWDRLARSRGLVFFLLVYLLPFTPDDVASYIAGMTPLNLTRLLAWGVIVRLPGMLVGNWFGATAPKFTAWQWALAAVYVFAWIGLTLRYYSQLEAAVTRWIVRVETWWAQQIGRKPQL
jgi:uncharacterized membrane protein YdjX (TVP38/TMEM64 family)